MRILILCTGNRCRSQMAHGILQSILPMTEVHSAGTRPANSVHPLAVQVMAEIGIDISHHVPKHVNQYVHHNWDHVITVCNGANQSCPTFAGNVTQRLHFGFDDPDAFSGSPDEVLAQFRRVRDEISAAMHSFALSVTPK